MKKIIILAILLCSCTTKEHQITQRDIAKYHYKAQEIPIAITECNGVKTTIYRQSIPQYEQQDEPTVSAIKQAGAVLTSPLGIIGGGALLLSQVEGNTTDSNNETTVNTTTEMIIPEEE